MLECHFRSSSNVAALIEFDRVLGGYFTVAIIRNPQNPILIMKAPTWRFMGSYK